MIVQGGIVEVAAPHEHAEITPARTEVRRELEGAGNGVAVGKGEIAVVTIGGKSVPAITDTNAIQVACFGTPGQAQRGHTFK